VSFGCHAGGLSLPLKKVVISPDCLDDWKSAGPIVDPGGEYSTGFSLPCAEWWCVAFCPLSNSDNSMGENIALTMVAGGDKMDNR